MEEIKNKRITKETIKKIAHLINERYLHFLNLHEQYEEETKDYKNPVNDEVRDYIVNGKPRLEISIRTENQTETKEDINWLYDFLDKRGNKIDALDINFMMYYTRNASNNHLYDATRASEDIYISLKSDYARIKFDFQNQDNGYDFLKNTIESLIKNSPESYDKTIINKGSRTKIPGLAIGLCEGLILSVALYLFCRFSGVNIYINEFILGDYFGVIALAISLLCGLYIPNKNHSLYRSLKIKQKYAGYSMSENKTLYKDDVRSFLDYCEVEIGEFNNRGSLRLEIEENYQKAKKKVWIYLALFVVFCVVTILI